MRTLRRSLLLWAGVFLAVACAKEGARPEPLISEPGVHTIQAGFATADPETRSRLVFSESEAQVLWTRGDAFKMLAYSMSDGKLKSKTYTTQEDGMTSATFSTSSSSSLSGIFFVSGYPASLYSRAAGRDATDNSFKVQVAVPALQHAVPGGLEEGLNRAVAWSLTPDEDLIFHNMLSIVRFRLEGGIVPDVTSVVFQAPKTIVGDATAFLKDGAPFIDFSQNWSTVIEPRSTSVTLEGTFIPGQDYCLAVVPTALVGFDMAFRNAQGDILWKHSSKPVTLGRSRVVDLGTIRLGDSWETVERPEVIEYRHQTRGAKKNVIAVLADGFMAQELDDFERLAKNAVDYLFDVEPFKTYKDYFTVYLFRAASNESGAGYLDENGQVITAVDNRFGSRWSEDNYSEMKANASEIQSYLTTHCPEIVAGELSYVDVPAVLLINDSRYGGLTHIFYGSGWCYAQVPFQRNGNSIRWSFPKYQAVNPLNSSEGSRETTEEEYEAIGRVVGDWRNTFLHEFGGHAYGRLTDEYWSQTTKYTEPGAIPGHSYAVPYALNVAGYPNQVPWQEDLLDHLDELTAYNPDYGRIGILQGAFSSLYYRWRSEMVSCMIDNRPYYSTWQRMLIVRRILDKVGEPFSMEDFLAKDVTTDPIRPVAGEPAEVRRQRAARTVLVPEMPMLPPPVEHVGENF